MLDWGCGLLSKEVYNICFDGNKIDGSVTLLKFEKLREEIIRMFVLSDVQVTDEIRSAVNTARPINKSKHNDYRSYYSDDLIQVVADKDKSIVAAGNYSF